MDKFDTFGKIGVYNTFDTFKQIYRDCSSAIDRLQTIHDKNREIYDKSIKSLNPESQYLGLDSINFKNKIDIANIQHYRHILSLTENRIYGDYYKIYKAVNKYIASLKLFDPSSIYIQQQSEDISSNTIITEQEFPVYKDIEPRNYDIELIGRIHNRIYEILKIIERDIISKKSSLDNRFSSRKSCHEPNILLSDYYITEEKSNLSIIQTRINMYREYILNAYNIHSIYLKTLSSQLYKNIEEEHINIDRHSSSEEAEGDCEAEGDHNCEEDGTNCEEDGE